MSAQNVKFLFMDPVTHMDRFRAFIVERRNALRLTQRELAKVAGMNAGTIAALEAGQVTRSPSIPTIKDLARGLKIDPRALVELLLTDLGADLQGQPADPDRLVKATADLPAEDMAEVLRFAEFLRERRLRTDQAL